MGIVTFIKQYELALMFIWAAALGCVFGILYDVFRIIRRSVRGADRNPVAYAFIFIQDIIFFIVAAAASAIFFYKFNSGRIRLSGIAFIIVGFSAYYFTLGKLVMLIADAIISFIRSLMRLVWKFICLLFSPVVMLFNFLSSCLRRRVRQLSLRIYTRATLVTYQKLLYKQ
jgi:Spore cortex protein YabQ (Spore_YabQ).